MSRYTGPSWKVSRRLGISLSGTGKELARRPYKPGQHGPNSRGKVSEYGMQLTEKQKLRHMYGMNERQFRTLFIKASKIKEGKHGVNFMVLLEQRLDNVVYRLGLATTRRQARQVIGVREKSQNISTIKEAVEATVGRPAFVSFDTEKLEGSFTRLPERDELYPEIDEALVVEYYNQKL